MTYPSKLYHRRLSALDDDAFEMGNLKEVPQSKNVLRQCSYEYRKGNRIDESLMTSLKALKGLYNEELKCRSVPGFIQYLSCGPLTIGMWSEKDIEHYHRMVNSHSVLVDATGTISLKINDKEIFYFSFLFFDRSVKTEPVPFLEILTDRATTNTLKSLLLQYLEDEMKRYVYTSHSVPVLCTTDCSWPILKCLVECLNAEKLEEYIA